MRTGTLAAVVVAVALLAGCGAEGGDQGRGVVATTTQLGDLVRQVTGERVKVTQILGPNADPHAYEPRPSDARALADAAVVFRSGGDLDDWLSDLVDAAGGDARSIDILERVGGGEDPHWWQDPRLALRAVEVIRAGLTESDPAGRTAYARNARALEIRLRRLDRDVAKCISELPPTQRKLVTTHDALGRFARRYGLTVIGAIIPSRSTQAQPSSRDTARLVDQIEEEGVRAIFPESSLGTDLERAVARETDARVGRELWVDSLGQKGSDGETYIGSVASNAERIVAGLSGGGVRCRPQA